VQFPITIGLRRSRFQVFFLGVLTLVAVLVCLLAPWSMLVQGALIVSLLLLALGAARRLDNPLLGLLLTKEGRLSVRFRGKDESYFPVTVLPGTTVHLWLTVLRMQYEAHPLTLLITPDCLAADDFRRLRVWLKWRAIFGETDGAA
jgi:toxin CptA